jgi:hypothetical protein
MGDPVKIITDVGLNLVTGGLYSVGKGAFETIQTGDPTHLLAQGLDLGLASVGNQTAIDMGGPIAGMAFNIAGATAGLAGGGLSALSPTGFGAESGVAPLAAAPSVGGIPLTPGALSSATGADIAGASLQGPIGAVAPAVETASTAPGGLANLAGLPATASSVAPTVASVAPETAGYVNAMTTAQAIQAANAAPSIASLSEPVKMALILAGGQMLTGGAGGLFTGLSAQKKLELEQLINQQNEQQRQYLNRNNQYAPLVTFKKPPSLANSIPVGQ